MARIPADFESTTFYQDSQRYKIFTLELLATFQNIFSSHHLLDTEPTLSQLPFFPPVTAGAIPNLSYLSIELDHLGDGVFDSLDRIRVAHLEINHAYHFSNQLDGFRDLADLIHLSRTKPFQKLSLYLAMDERFNEIEWEEDVPDEWGDNWNVEWRGEHWSDLIETPQLINLIDVCQRKRIEIKIYGSDDGEAFQEFVEWEIVGAGKNNGSRRR